MIRSLVQALSRSLSSTFSGDSVVDLSTPAAGSLYRRPGGADQYFRPGGADDYLRP